MAATVGKLGASPRTRRGAGKGIPMPARTRSARHADTPATPEVAPQPEIAAEVTPAQASVDGTVTPTPDGNPNLEGVAHDEGTDEGTAPVQPESAPVMYDGKVGDRVVTVPAGAIGTIVGFFGDGDANVQFDGATLTAKVPLTGIKAAPKNKALIAVALDVLGDSEDVPEDEWDSAPLIAPEERDATQLVFDADVKDAFDKWVTAGKPVTSKSPRKRRLVAPEHGPAVRFMIHKAARFLGYSATISPPAYNKDGKEIITYSVREKGETRNRKGDAGKAAIRAWAKSEGLEVSERGRIPEDVSEAYAKAHPDAPNGPVEASTAPAEGNGDDEGNTDDGNGEGDV